MWMDAINYKKLMLEELPKNKSNGMPTKWSYILAHNGDALAQWKCHV